LGFYFFLINSKDEKNLVEMLLKENGMLIDRFGQINLLIKEKTIIGSSDICLKDDEEFLLKKYTQT